MTKEEVIQSIRAGKLVTKRDWLGDGIGLLCLLIFFAGSTLMVFFPTSPAGPLLILFFLLSTSAFLYGFYCLIRENDLVKLETNLDATLNRQLIIAVFKEQAWLISQNTAYVIIADKNTPTGLIAQETVAIIEQNYINLNVKHKGTSKGRSPFSFGCNQESLDRIREKIDSNAPNITYTNHPAASPQTQA